MRSLHLIIISTMPAEYGFNSNLFMNLPFLECVKPSRFIKTYLPEEVNDCGITGEVGV